MSRPSSVLLLSSVLAAVLGVGSVVAPVPYVALGPGPTFDTLGSEGDTAVIRIEGRQVFATDGHLRLTTVGVQDRLTLGEALLDWFRRDEAVVPRELIFPPGRTNAEVDAENTRQMVESQDSATTAALTQLGIPLPVRVAAVTAGSPAQGRLQAGDVLTAVDGAAVTGPAQLRSLIGARAPGAQVALEVSRGGELRREVLTTAASADTPPRPVVGVETAVDYPFQVTIGLKDVGGPSAGLMFALGIIDKLGPESLTGDRAIAGTGEITPDGDVRPIGGIQQKLDGAVRDGATVFLVPAANCADAAANRPDGLQLVRVTTLGDALAQLQALRDGGTPTPCAA